VVFYNRANEAGAMLKAEDFDWDEIVGQGVRWLHSGVSMPRYQVPHQA